MKKDSVLFLVDGTLGLESPPLLGNALTAIVETIRLWAVRTDDRFEVSVVLYNTQLSGTFSSVDESQEGPSATDEVYECVHTILSFNTAGVDDVLHLALLANVTSDPVNTLGLDRDNIPDRPGLALAERTRSGLRDGLIVARREFASLEQSSYRRLVLVSRPESPTSDLDAVSDELKVLRGEDLNVLTVPLLLRPQLPSSAKSAPRGSDQEKNVCSDIDGDWETLRRVWTLHGPIETRPLAEEKLIVTPLSEEETKLPIIVRSLAERKLVELRGELHVGGMRIGITGYDVIASSDLRKSLASFNVRGEQLCSTSTQSNQKELLRMSLAHGAAKPELIIDDERCTKREREITRRLESVFDAPEEIVHVERFLPSWSVIDLLHLGTPVLLQPSDRNLTNSRAAFAALWRSMRRQNKVADVTLRRKSTFDEPRLPIHGYLFAFDPTSRVEELTFSDSIRYRGHVLSHHEELYPSISTLSGIYFVPVPYSGERRRPSKPTDTFDSKELGALTKPLTSLLRMFYHKTGYDPQSFISREHVSQLRSMEARAMNITEPLPPLPCDSSKPDYEEIAIRGSATTSVLQKLVSSRISMDREADVRYLPTLIRQLMKRSNPVYFEPMQLKLAYTLFVTDHDLWRQLRPETSHNGRRTAARLIEENTGTSLNPKRLHNHVCAATAWGDEHALPLQLKVAVCAMYDHLPIKMGEGKEGEDGGEEEDEEAKTRTRSKELDEKLADIFSGYRKRFETEMTTKVLGLDRYPPDSEASVDKLGDADWIRVNQPHRAVNLVKPTTGKTGLLKALRSEPGALGFRPQASIRDPSEELQILQDPVPEAAGNSTPPALTAGQPPANESSNPLVWKLLTTDEKVSRFLDRILLISRRPSPRYSSLVNPLDRWEFSVPVYMPTEWLIPLSTERFEVISFTELVLIGILLNLGKILNRGVITQVLKAHFDQIVSQRQAELNQTANAVDATSRSVIIKKYLMELPHSRQLERDIRHSVLTQNRVEREPLQVLSLMYRLPLFGSKRFLQKYLRVYLKSRPIIMEAQKNSLEWATPVNAPPKPPPALWAQTPDDTDSGNQVRRASVALQLDTSMDAEDNDETKKELLENMITLQRETERAKMRELNQRDLEQRQRQGDENHPKILESIQNDTTEREAKEHSDIDDKKRNQKKQRQQDERDERGERGSFERLGRLRRGKVKSPIKQMKQSHVEAPKPKAHQETKATTMVRRGERSETEDSYSSDVSCSYSSDESSSSDSYHSRDSIETRSIRRSLNDRTDVSYMGDIHTEGDVVERKRPQSNTAKSINETPLTHTLLHTRTNMGNNDLQPRAHDYATSPFPSRSHGERSRVTDRSHINTGRTDTMHDDWYISPTVSQQTASPARREISETLDDAGSSRNMWLGMPNNNMLLASASKNLPQSLRSSPQSLEDVMGLPNVPDNLLGNPQHSQLSENPDTIAAPLPSERSKLKGKRAHQRTTLKRVADTSVELASSSSAYTASDESDYDSAPAVDRKRRAADVPDSANKRKLHEKATKQQAQAQPGSVEPSNNPYRGSPYGGSPYGGSPYPTGSPYASSANEQGQPISTLNMLLKSFKERERAWLGQAKMELMALGDFSTLDPTQLQFVCRALHVNNSGNKKAMLERINNAINI